METVVVVNSVHNGNQHHYCGGKSGRGTAKFSPGNFKGISCRSFQSGAGAGLLPTPLKSLSSPVCKNAFCDALSPKTPSPCFDEIQKSSKRTVKSNSIPIPMKMKFENEGDFHFSELWAGPAYSNSPPPSSLPLPNFFMRPKRTVSLDLPTFASEIDIRSTKSAPASPTRGRSPSPNDLFNTADSATKTLRRILNLDIIDG